MWLHSNVTCRRVKVKIPIRRRQPCRTGLGQERVGGRSLSNFFKHECRCSALALSWRACKIREKVWSGCFVVWWPEKRGGIGESKHDILLLCFGRGFRIFHGRLPSYRRHRTLKQPSERAPTRTYSARPIYSSRQNATDTVQTQYLYSSRGF